MEDDFEEYWAAIRPMPLKSLIDLREELLRISNLRSEAYREMVGSPPTSEALFDNHFNEPGFESRGGIPTNTPLVVNVDDLPNFSEVTTREYADSVLHTYSDAQPFHIDGNGLIQIDSPESPSIQFGHPPGNR